MVLKPETGSKWREQRAANVEKNRVSKVMTGAYVYPADGNGLPLGLDTKLHFPSPIYGVFFFYQHQTTPHHAHHTTPHHATPHSLSLVPPHQGGTATMAVAKPPNGMTAGQWCALKLGAEVIRLQRYHFVGVDFPRSADAIPDEEVAAMKLEVSA